MRSMQFVIVYSFVVCSSVFSKMIADFWRIILHNVGNAVCKKLFAMHCTIITITAVVAVSNGSL